MRRSYILCTLGLSLLLFSGCAKEQAQMAYIGAETAKQLALEISGLTADGVEAITADLNTHNGVDYYQIDFTAAGQSYQYDIDALTGVVIEANSPNAAPEGSLVTDADTYDAEATVDAADHAVGNAAVNAVDPAVGNAVDHDTDKTAESQQPAAGQTQGGGMLSASEAETVALDHAGLEREQVTFIKSKSDYEKGRQIYEVEFRTQDAQEYDYEIDAYTGEIISFDYDAELCALPAAAGGVEITSDAAKELALAQVPGAAVGDIVKFKVDYDDGRMEYEGKIVYSGMEYEFEIDGYSGAFRSWEVKPVSADSYKN